MTFLQQLFFLFVLPVPIACIAWTFTHEEIFRELHEFCVEKSESGKTLFTRKFFYMLTCEYCFSHYVTILFLIITHFQLLLPGWRGYIISGFSVVWIANVYMSLYNRVRITLKKDKTEIKLIEEEVEK